jgi:hypothetical protein
MAPAAIGRRRPDRLNDDQALGVDDLDEEETFPWKPGAGGIRRERDHSYLWPRGFFPLLNGGELAIVYCFLFLYFWLAGGGEWSLDRLRAPASASALSPSRA